MTYWAGWLSQEHGDWSVTSPQTQLSLRADVVVATKRPKYDIPDHSVIAAQLAAHSGSSFRNKHGFGVQILEMENSSNYNIVTQDIHLSISFVFSSLIKFCTESFLHSS